jgi:hypothetical protein
MARIVSVVGVRSFSRGLDTNSLGPGTLFTDYEQLTSMPSEPQTGGSARQPRQTLTGFGFFFAS